MDSGESVDERSYAIALMKFPGQLVLDVGTGHCACVAAILAEKGRRVLASDNDARSIRDARRLITSARLDKRVCLVRDDITASGLRSGSFRNIVCFNALHHVSALRRALGELRRILATDGRLVISEFDEKGDGFLDRLQRTVGRLFPSVVTYPRPESRLVLVCEARGAVGGRTRLGHSAHDDSEGER